jgi:DNA polymerase-3 subunit delta
MKSLPPSKMKRSVAHLANQVYLFYGEEELLIREKISELKKQVADSSMNLEQIDAEGANLEEIVSALQTQPLLFGEKLTIIKNADLKLELWDAVLPALDSIPATTTVVFWASAVSKRSKIFKRIDAIGEVYEFKPFADWEQDKVAYWVMQRVKSGGKIISRDVALRLIEICGNNLSKLSSEIEKIITYIGDNKQIGLKDVEALASPGQLSIFSLSDAVADKDLKTGLATFNLLQKNKVEFFSVLSLLANRYRIMLMAKSERDPMKISKVLKANPYYVKKCLRREAAFSEKELIRNLGLILEADLSLKSGQSRSSVFELLLTSLCGN